MENNHENGEGASKEIPGKDASDLVVPTDFDSKQCYAALLEQRTAIAASKSTADQNKRNIGKLSRSSLDFEARLLHLERNKNLG